MVVRESKVSRSSLELRLQSCSVFELSFFHKGSGSSSFIDLSLLNIPQALSNQNMPVRYGPIGSKYIHIVDTSQQIGASQIT